MPRRESDSGEKSGRLHQLFSNLLKLGGKDDSDDPAIIHSKTSSQPQGAFIGGFRTENGLSSNVPSGYTQPGYAALHPPPVPPKAGMAMPQPMHFNAARPSMTTQIALQQWEGGQSVPNLPSPPALLRPPSAPLRPHSDSDVPKAHASPPKTRPAASSPATPPKSQGKLDAPGSPPNRGGRRRSSPGSLSGTVTCSGTTKSGEPCKNPAKRPTALGRVDSDADADIERYCHVHIKEVLKPSGFQSPKANEWVSYDGGLLRAGTRALRSHDGLVDWIPAYLQEDTRAALRHEMNKSASASDRDGYIYTFEIRGACPPRIPRRIPLKLLQTWVTPTACTSRPVGRLIS